MDQQPTIQHYEYPPLQKEEDRNYVMFEKTEKNDKICTCLPQEINKLRKAPMNGAHGFETYANLLQRGQA